MSAWAPGLKVAVTRAGTPEPNGVGTVRKVGIGSPGTFQAACTAGINAGSQALYGAITKVDSSALEFGIQGLAKGVDKNKDGHIDVIQTGAWSGTLSYSGTAAPLSRGNFIGAPP